MTTDPLHETATRAWAPHPAHHVEDRLISLKTDGPPLDSADSSPSTPRRERVLAHILLTIGRHRVAQNDTRATQDGT
jgi:hypothetical protein